VSAEKLVPSRDASTLSATPGPTTRRTSSRNASTLWPGIMRPSTWARACEGITFTFEPASSTVGEAVLRSMAFRLLACEGAAFSSRRKRCPARRGSSSRGKTCRSGERDPRATVRKKFSTTGFACWGSRTDPSAATARASLTTALCACGIDPCPGAPSATISNQQMPFSATCTG
jgi:hypothetical protein